MIKYYIIFHEKNKLPVLLLNDNFNGYGDEKEDRVMYWLKKSTALKELKAMKKRYPKERYNLVKEVL